MPRPLDCTPLRDAVVHALTQATSQPHSLAKNPGIGKSQFFVELASPEPSAGAAVDGPGVYVEIKDHIGDPTGQPVWSGDVLREAVTVEVTCIYSGANRSTLAESRLLRRVIERDRQRVITALTQDGALETDPNGASTGADGGSLRFDGYSSRGPTYTAKPLLVSVVHVFRTTVELSKPAQ